MSNLQTINLADHVNAAVDKINENFAGLDSAVSNITINIDSADITNIINNTLDSDYFITVFDSDYFQQFIINPDVSYLESDISANASALLSLTARIDVTDSSVLVLSQAQLATQAQLEGLVLDGIDSAVLDAAIANANTTLISRIEANSDSISILAGSIDSVNSQLILLDENTDSRIAANATAISSLTTRINATDSDLSIVSASVTQLDVNLQQLINDGITITDEQVIEAVGGALSLLETRIETNSDGLRVVSESLDSLSASLISIDSDINARVDAEADARSTLTATVSTQGGQITSISSDVTELDNAIFIRDPETGDVTSTAITNAVSDLRNEIVEENGLIQSALSAERTSISAEIDGDISTLNNTLRAYVDAQTGNTVAEWTLDLSAGSTDDPYIAGLSFTNDSRTADFVIRADTFKLVPAGASDGTAGQSPFTVTGNDVFLSNATVTGGLNVTTSDNDGSMTVTGNLITIRDANNTPRVKLGKLTL